ncbi:MAG: DNA polymerase III subunit beta [Elusimicrobiales bacterium]|nr:DNA polymerase III subunit beta [Elusimicrobiales bacterium]MCK5584069.1 DNA polymerase III subunit beta [Elusimicrobiales bacterium]
MKINSNKENLLKGLQTIQTGVSSKTGTIPILQNFLMETKKEGLKIVFTDLEMAIKHFIKVDIEKEGSVTVPIKKFMEIVHTLENNKDISITVDSANKTTINSGKSKFKVGGLPKADYPVIPDMDESNSFKISAPVLAEMIEKTIFSASNEDERHFLNGLLWTAEKKIFSMVATDGRRLAINKHNDIKVKQDFKIIVPSKILNELVKFIKASDFSDKDEFLIGLSSNQIGFKINKTVFVSRLIEGNFPAYEQIIPKSPETSVDLDTQKLLDITKRAVICSNERNGVVKYEFKKNILIVKSSSQNMDFEDEMDIDYKEKDFQINFNPKYIMDILKSIGDKKIVFKLTSSSTPIIIESLKNKDLLYIVMPLRS